MRVNQRIGGALVTVRERGVITKGLRNRYNQASKEAWGVVGRMFHDEMRDKRFTPEHAEKARYYKRKGQNYRPSMKVFGRYYYGRKWLSAKHGGGKGKADPMVFTGETRRAVQFANFEPTRYGVRIIYPGARGLNRRHPKSQIRMREEFTRLLPEEIAALADRYDQELDKRWKGPS